MAVARVCGLGASGRTSSPRKSRSLPGLGKVGGGYPLGSLRNVGQSRGQTSPVLAAHSSPSPSGFCRPLPPLPMQWEGGVIQLIC